MYTRSYEDDRRMPIPEDYGGTVMGEAESSDTPAREIKEESETAPVFGGLFGLGHGLSSIFGSAKGMKFGTEELLLAGVAMFLLFSKNGDKECAIILLLSLFIAK